MGLLVSSDPWWMGIHQKLRGLLKIKQEHNCLTKQCATEFWSKTFAKYPYWLTCINPNSVPQGHIITIPETVQWKANREDAKYQTPYVMKNNWRRQVGSQWKRQFLFEIFYQYRRDRHRSHTNCFTVVKGPEMKEQCKKNRSKRFCFNAWLTQANITWRRKLKFLTELRGDLLNSSSGWIHLSSQINWFVLDQFLLKSQPTAKFQLRKNKRQWA